MKRMAWVLVLIILFMDFHFYSHAHEVKHSPQPNTVEGMLMQEKGLLRQPVIDKVLSILHCADVYHLNYQPILSVIDYSLPASQKRLWIFDLKQKKLLFHTYVSHGIRSGELSSTYFSNRYDSKTSSIGVYRTEKAYYGREGLSLKLEGLEPAFNDNAYNRSIVMHGGWYLEDEFIRKYGRSGRSWGCPAVPLHLVNPIVNTIKDKSLFVVYYPDEQWFLKSKYLQCEHPSYIAGIEDIFQQTTSFADARGEVFFADKTFKEAETSPIVVMSASRYKDIFQNKPPLTRMLRRQIEKMEYIALNRSEFILLMKTMDPMALTAIQFVIPVLKMQRGYYATEMRLVDLGKVAALNDSEGHFNIQFESGNHLQIRAVDHFIRWLGL